MKLRKIVFLLAVQLLFPFGLAASSFDHEYAAYERLLQQHVDSGLVDYRAIKADRALLDSVNAQFGRVTKSEYETFTREQQMAYLLNAYNYYTIVAIVNAYPVESIKEIDGVWDDMEWPVAGRSLTLDDIEHDILRKKFKEPRIHAAVVCASLSCPELWDRAFTADSLGGQLELRSEAFIRDPQRNRFDADDKTLFLSKIFDWYGKDFIGRYGDHNMFGYLGDKKGATVGFFYEHAPDAWRQRLIEGRLDVEYLDYDWSLNEQR